MGQVCGRKAISEELSNTETANAVDVDGDEAERITANSASTKSSAETEEERKTEIVQSENDREEDKSSAEKEQDREEGLAVQTQEGREAGVVETSLQQKQPKDLLQEPLAVTALSEEPSRAETATAVEMGGENEERMAASSARDDPSAETEEDSKTSFAPSEGGREEDKSSAETVEDREEGLPVLTQDGREDDKSSAETEEDREEGLALLTQDGIEAAAVENSGHLHAPLAVTGPSEEPSSAETAAATAAAAAAAAEMGGDAAERITANSASWDKLSPETEEDRKTEFALSEDGREDGELPAEKEQDREEVLAVQTQKGGAAAVVANSDLLHEPLAVKAPSEEPSSAKTAAAVEMGGGDEERMAANSAQSEDGREEDKSSTEKEHHQEEGLAVQTQEGREAAVVETSLQQKQPKDLLHEPLAVIDMPRLLSGEIEVFVLTSTADWVMIVMRPTGSVVDLKRAIKDAKDAAYHHKFGELVGYYPYFSSGNLELYGQTLHDTYSLKQGDVLVEEKIHNSFILRGKCRRLEKCGGGGSGSDRWGGEASDDFSDPEVHGGLDLSSVQLREHLSATAGMPRQSCRLSDVDLRQMHESRALYWKFEKGRRVMFVNRTDKLVYVFVFPGQEKHRELAGINAAAPTPAGPVEPGATIQATREAHSGVFKPATIALRGVSASSAAILPPFEVFNIWRNTGRRVHFVVATLEGDDVSVWKRADAEGGQQVHIQPPMFSPEVLPIFRKGYKTADGDGDALSVVMSNFL